MAATELASRLRAYTGVALPPTLVFEQPTSRAISLHLLDTIKCNTAASVMSVRARLSDMGAKLALGSMVGRWPGGCSGDAAHSQLLHDRCFRGRSCESTCGLDHSYLSGMMQKAYAANSGLYKQHIDPLRSDYSRQSRLSVGAVLVPCEKDFVTVFVRRNPGEVGGPRRVLVRG